MILDDRKRSILEAIISDYITTAEPIGSRAVAKKHELGLSSATIRNEMADLEELGYLNQPHISAGRIPSDKGYRMYVDQLMKSFELAIGDIELIEKAMEVKINELSQLIRQASVVLSNLTSYTSLAVTAEMKKIKFKAVQVVPIGIGKALVVVVSNADIVKNTIIKISSTIMPDDLIRISNIFNEKLCGLTIEEINFPVIKEIENLMGKNKEVLMPVLDGVVDCINRIDNSEIYLYGSNNILNHPEFNDISRAKDFLNFMDEKAILIKLLTKSNHGNDDFGWTNIKIGNENSIDQMRDCSVITTTYNIGNIVIGSIGLIGPTRMDYPRVVSLMNHMRKKLNEELKALIGDNIE